MATTDIANYPQMTEADRSQVKTTVEAILRSGHFRLEADGAMYDVPTAVGRQILVLLQLNAAGKPPEELSAGTEVTVRQAAAFLQVPEQYLTELLDSEVIPSRRSGKERLLTLGDLLEFDRETKQMQEGLDEIVQLSQEMGLYDDY